MHAMAPTPKRESRKAAEPPAEPGVLFVRNVPPAVMAALDEWARDLTAERGSSVSRVDVVREVLHRAVQDRAKKAGK